MKRQPSVVSKISGIARERRGRLAHHEGRAAHALDPARDGDRHLARGNCPGRGGDRFHAGRAQPVHRHAGHRMRNAGKQQRHPRDIAIVLAGLVGATHDHFVDGRKVALGELGAQGCERMGGEIVRAD